MASGALEGPNYAISKVSRSAGSSGSACRVCAGAGFNRRSDRAELRPLQRASGVRVRVLFLLSVRLRALWVLGPGLFCGRSVHRRWAVGPLLLHTAGLLSPVLLQSRLRIP